MWLLIIGILVGLLSSFMGGILFGVNGISLLLAISIIVFAVSIIGELIIHSTLSKQQYGYYLPIYGIVALTFNIIGLLILFYYPNTFNSPYGMGGSDVFWNSLLIIPFALIALVSAGIGLISEKNLPSMALLNFFLGTILITISVWPVVYYVLAFAVVLFGGV